MSVGSSSFQEENSIAAWHGNKQAAVWTACDAACNAGMHLDGNSHQSAKMLRRSDSCEDCVGPDGEDVSGGYYEAGGSFLKLGFVEAFLVTSFLQAY